MTRARKSWWLYLLECADGRLYCGIAKDPQARFEQHRAGKGAKFTRGAGAKRILAMRRCRSRSTALKAEYALKQLKLPQKRDWARKHGVPAGP